MASPKMSLKLLVDRRGSRGPRVLFAEAPKEFVDFLFHIFSLPLGNLLEFIGSNQMVGSLGKLKDSIESFHANYLQPDIKMDDIFNHETSFNDETFMLSYDHASSKNQSGASRTAYRCAGAIQFMDNISDPGVSYLDIDGRPICGYKSCCSNVIMYANSICPNCNTLMNYEMKLIMPKELPETKEEGKKPKGGYVKEVVTYMVMDNLVVKPMSTISSITLINKLGVTDLSQLEEKMVSFGKDEGLKLLNASLKTDEVLTTIFMH